MFPVRNGLNQAIISLLVSLYLVGSVDITLIWGHGEYKDIQTSLYSMSKIWALKSFTKLHKPYIHFLKLEGAFISPQRDSRGCQFYEHNPQALCTGPQPAQLSGWHLLSEGSEKRPIPVLLPPALALRSAEPAGIVSAGVRAKSRPLGKRECRSHHASPTATKTGLASAVHVEEELVEE